MTETSDQYLLRAATSEDAPLIAAQRAHMFLDMRLLLPQDLAPFLAATEPWMSALLTSGDYKGWFLDHNGEAVAGAGLRVSQTGPIPGCIRTGKSAHIANVYTSPFHRRRGLAKRLIVFMLQWCAENAVDQVTLEASPDGRSLYESLGFTPVPILKLNLPHPA